MLLLPVCVPPLPAPSFPASVSFQVSGVMRILPKRSVEAGTAHAPQSPRVERASPGLGWPRVVCPSRSFVPGCEAPRCGTAGRPGVGGSAFFPIRKRSSTGRREARRWDLEGYLLCFSQPTRERPLAPRSRVPRVPRARGFLAVRWSCSAVSPGGRGHAPS